MGHLHPKPKLLCSNYYKVWQNLTLSEFLGKNTELHPQNQKILPKNKGLLQKWSNSTQQIKALRLIVSF